MTMAQFEQIVTAIVSQALSPNIIVWIFGGYF